MARKHYAHVPVAVNIKRVDKTLPLPKYQTQGSVGFDLTCRTDAEIAPGTIELIPANVIVDTPQDFMLMVCLRSSTPRRLGLMMPQGVGIVDQDYCGEEDELQIQVYNFTDEVVKVKRGDRIAQAVFVRVSRARRIEREKMTAESRGGFGSTGSM